MNLVLIGQGHEPPLGDYCGIRIEKDGLRKIEVRLSGTAAAIMMANQSLYGDVYQWIEQVATAIYNTGEVENFETLLITSYDINDKRLAIKNWKKFIK